MTLFVIEFLFLFVSEWFCFAKQIKQQIFYNFIWILSENFRSDYINLNSLRQFCAIVIKFQFHSSYCVRTGLLDVYRDLPHCEIVRRSADRGREFPQSRRDQMFPSVKPGGPCAPFVLDSDFRFDLNILPFATFFFPPTHSEQSPLYNCTDSVGSWIFGMCQGYDFVIPPGRRRRLSMPSNISAHIISDISCRNNREKKMKLFLLIALLQYCHVWIYPVSHLCCSIPRRLNIDCIRLYLYCPTAEFHRLYFCIDKSDRHSSLPLFICYLFFFHPFLDVHRLSSAALIHSFLSSLCYEYSRCDRWQR